MSPSPLLALTDALLFDGTRLIRDKTLVLKGDKIEALADKDAVPAEARRLSCPDSLITPGLIDIQVNGGGNFLLNTAPDSIAEIVHAHQSRGTAHICPTCVSDTPDIVHAVLKAFRAAKKAGLPGLLGLHIEGPHLSPGISGIHDENNLRPMTAKDLETYRPQADETILLTFSPDQVTTDYIRALTASGLFMSIGHTKAPEAAIRAALAAGATGFTHLYNRMGAMTARVPGPAGVALDDRASWCGLIADARHVAPEMVRLAFRAKPQDKIILVSDAMPPAGADVPRPYQLGQRTVVVEDRVCRAEDGTLAGPALTLAEIIPIAIHEIGLPAEAVLAAATANPAAFLRLTEKGYGHLAPGARADLSFFDHLFAPKGLWMAGQQVMER